MKWVTGFCALLLGASATLAEPDRWLEPETQLAQPIRTVPVDVQRLLKKLPPDQRKMIEEYFRRVGRPASGQGNAVRW